jgi:hypothetical protein
MAHSLRRYDQETTKGGTVVPFRRASGETTHSFFINDLIKTIFDAPEFGDKMKEFIEGYIMDISIKNKEQSLYPSILDNPFDAIYLADLQPDAIPLHTIFNLDSLSNIRDLSNTISFNDDWGD